MSSGTYANLSPALRDHYSKIYIDVKIDPPGRGMPDILGVKADGSVFVGEIKSAKEASGSASSWWHHWTRAKRDLRKNYGVPPPDQPSSAKGWCAVIDGQLREYCERQNVAEGDLVVEDGGNHQCSIEQALAFLKSQCRVTSWSHTADHSLGYWTIQFV